MITINFPGIIEGITIVVASGYIGFKIAEGVKKKEGKQSVARQLLVKFNVQIEATCKHAASFHTAFESVLLDSFFESRAAKYKEDEFRKKLNEVTDLSVLPFTPQNAWEILASTLDELYQHHAELINRRVVEHNPITQHQAEEYRAKLERALKETRDAIDNLSEFIEPLNSTRKCNYGL